MSDHDDIRQLMRLGKTIDRRIRCLLIYCARCELKVLRVERDNRDRGEPRSMNGALWTLGGLIVQRDGARKFREYRQGVDLRRTFTWECAHGHKDTRTLERFLRAWPQHVMDDAARPQPPRVIKLKLGVDV